jgi:NADPH:quinone reductase-like Zn-dependent oxidoreductase
MRAVVIREHGGFEKLLFEQRDRPEPGPGQVRIRVHAAGMNHLDTWVRRGVEGARFPLPIVPGSDCAGVVEAVGPGVEQPRQGDAVVLAPGFGCYGCPQCAAGNDPLCRKYSIFGESCDGTCAEAIVVPAQNALPKPPALSYPEAGSFALTFLTAYHMLVTRADLKPHETILIHAAGSGVSGAAIQIARLIGSRILVTAGSEEKLERAQTLGANEGILYREQDFLSEVRKLTGKRGVDVVIDHVGQDTLDRSLKALSKGGRLVTCGGTSGPELKTDVRLVFFKGLSILGSTMGSLAEMHVILEHFRRGNFEPDVDRVLPLEQVAEGHRILQEREVNGKVVLTNEEPNP